MTRLYDIPSLPDSFFKLRTETTELEYSDPHTVDNFMQEAIRDRGSDKPVFEHELPRQRNNAANQSLLTMSEFGSRYTRDPYHPELFLGDLTKDPRQSDTEPMVAQMRDQHQFRQERYIRGKLQDVSEDQLEGMVGTKRMLRQVKDGFYDTATRLGGIFDESFNTMVVSANPHPGDSIHKPEDTIKEDRTVYQIQDEKILPKYSTDIVSKLTNMIGNQWQSRPDARYGLSSVSNVYRSKGEVDKSVDAVFRLGRQDTQFKAESEQFKNGTSVPRKDIIKQARRNYQEVKVDLKNDSAHTRTERFAALPANVSKVLATLTTQSKKEHMSSTHRTLKRTITGKKETLIEDIKTKDITEVLRGSTIPAKDKLSIVRHIERMQESSNRTEDRSKHATFNTKALARALIQAPMSKHEQTWKNNIQQHKTSNGAPGKAVDHVSNNKLTDKKYAQTKERLQANLTGSNVVYTPTTTDDIVLDIDPTLNNKSQYRKGASQLSASMIFVKTEQDSSISPVNDTIAPYATNYKKDQ